MKPECAVLVFAKAPVAGLAKTRLAPALGFDGAARLAERMLDETLRKAIAAGVGSVSLYCTPDVTHPAFMNARMRYGIRLAHQGEGDLGERMSRAMEHALVTHKSALLIGTDAPNLDADCLRHAAGALQSHDAVFAPTVDGGYVLVGLSRNIPEIFDDVSWGTAEVMRKTRARLSSMNTSWVALPVLNDVDAPEDLAHVPPEWLK